MNDSKKDKNQNNIYNFTIKNTQIKNSTNELNDNNPEIEDPTKVQFHKAKVIDQNSILFTSNKLSNLIKNSIDQENLSSKRELRNIIYTNNIQITKNPNLEKLPEVQISPNNNKSKKTLKSNKSEATNENNDEDILIQDKKYKSSNISSMTDKSENTSKSIVVRCIFCDVLFEITNNDEQFYNKCGHYFCKKCGKIYYEDLIQNYINSYNTNNNISFVLKCPIFDCQNKISDNLLHKIISKKYYSELNNILTLNNNTNSKNENKLNVLKKNNVLDINNDKEKYLLFIKKLYLKCPLCEEFSLFTKINGHFLKCLKCQNKYCRYCRKLYDLSHFDVSNKNYCKVYYRVNNKKKTKNFFMRYLMNLIYVIFGYLFFFTFFILMMKKVIKSKKRLFSKILWCFICLVEFIFFAFVCIIFLPYFPIINCL